MRRYELFVFGFNRNGGGFNRSGFDFGLNHGQNLDVFSLDLGRWSLFDLGRFLNNLDRPLWRDLSLWEIFVTNLFSDIVADGIRSDADIDALATQIFHHALRILFHLACKIVNSNALSNRHT